MHSYAERLTWVLEIRTQVVMLAQQVPLPTQPSPQSQGLWCVCVCVCVCMCVCLSVCLSVAVAISPALLAFGMTFIFCIDWHRRIEFTAKMNMACFFLLFVCFLLLFFWP